ncbi:MAG: hypothetical protein FWH37_05610 [Candidatus Bathyarchaeota archaeon]|nr:hypothetical protein [Candidatus Termiticorpusculum sp.]
MSDIVDRGLKKAGIHVSKPILAVICVIFGLALFIFPELVGYLIGVFLLVQGIIFLVEYYSSSGNKKS